MARQIEKPIKDDHGHEQHPSWVLIGASRMSVSPPGATLFDSDIRHQHVVAVRITRAVRDRHLNHDWLFGREQIIEVEMSEAQWASFVSSMNTGDGVPATMTHLHNDWAIPGMPFEPRIQESLREVRTAAEKAIEEVRKAFEQYENRKTVGNLRHLRAMIDNLPANIEYAGKTLAEHAENVVTRARADIEAFVVTKARSLGLDPSDLGLAPLELTQGGNHETPEE